jgi:DNA-binding MarR family transcriptional regulator
MKTDMERFTEDLAELGAANMNLTPTQLVSLMAVYQSNRIANALEALAETAKHLP